MELFPKCLSREHGTWRKSALARSLWYREELKVQIISLFQASEAEMESTELGTESGDI